MRKLDRLVWADGIALESYGARVGIRVNTPQALPYLRERFPPQWCAIDEEEVPALLSVRLSLTEARPGIRPFHLVYEGAARMARTHDLGEALNAFESALQILVAAEAPDHVFIHAGVVAWNGKAILLPGKSHAGKTTLVTELLRAGATYYSDEYAVMNDQGLVHPYPRQLSVREGEPVRSVRYPAVSFGATVGQDPIPVGLIVESEYQAGSRWMPRQLTPGQGALSLLSNTVPARLRPAASLAVIRRMVEVAPVLRGPRGEARETAGEILGRLELSRPGITST